MIKFVVHGHPAPQGSARAFVPKGWTRAIVTSANPKLKPWRQQVAGEAMSLGLECIVAHVPVSIRLSFYFDPPQKMPKGRTGMTTKPDVDKLARGILDALKGILIHDDSQVNHLDARKFYGSPERVEIEVEVEL